MTLFFRQMLRRSIKIQKGKGESNEAEETRTCGPSLANWSSLAACGSPSEPSGSTPLTPILPLPVRLSPARRLPRPTTPSRRFWTRSKLTIAAEGNWVPYVYNEDGTGEAYRL